MDCGSVAISSLKIRQTKQQYIRTRLPRESIGNSLDPRLRGSPKLRFNVVNNLPQVTYDTNTDRVAILRVFDVASKLAYASFYLFLETLIVAIHGRASRKFPELKARTVRI